LFGLFDVLSSVGVGWESFVIGAPEEPLFDVKIVAATREPFRCAGNVLVAPRAALDEAEDVDVALVSGLVVPAWDRLRDHDGKEFDWLARQHTRGAVIASACTGALVLAESGLLNGCEATTHWAYADVFRVHYREVRLRPDLDLCGSGNHNQIVTSGGATAWQSLALHLICRFCGIEYAIRAAKFWLIPGREVIQAPYSAVSRSVRHEDAVIIDCQAWLAEHYGGSNPVSTMIRLSGLPPTTFARRFKRATSHPPIDYVHTLRIEEAKEMLETGTHAVDEIGREVGYEDPASFRRLFKRKAGVTPSDYRRRFGRTRFERYHLAQ
jgi:transcriptional regulator GlxA family with amidase domain